MKKNSQINDILKYLQKNGSITSMEAFEHFHATRLAAVIFQLRKRGHNITTVDCVGRNSYGTYKYAKYILEEN